MYVKWTVHVYLTNQKEASISIQRGIYFQILIFSFYHYNFASGSEIAPCDKIDKPLVVYIFSGDVMASITTLST